MYIQNRGAECAMSNRDGVAVVTFTGRCSTVNAGELGAWVGDQIQSFLDKHHRLPSHVVADFTGLEVHGTGLHPAHSAASVGWSVARERGVALSVVADDSTRAFAQVQARGPGPAYYATMADAFEALPPRP